MDGDRARNGRAGVPIAVSYVFLGLRDGVGPEES